MDGMISGPRPNRLPLGTNVIAADWGRVAGKRSAYVASCARRWTIRRKDPGVGGWSLKALVSEAQRLRDHTGASVLVGIDAVLGVPASYAEVLGEPSFFDCLRRLSRSGGLFAETPLGVWNSVQPFFRIPPGPSADCL